MTKPAIGIAGETVCCVGALPVGVCGHRFNLATGLAGAGRAGDGRVRDDIVDGLELWARPRLGLANASGDNSHVDRGGGVRRADLDRAAGGQWPGAGGADRPGGVGASSAIGSVLCAESAGLGAGHFHPLPWPGAMGGLAVAVCGHCLAVDARGSEALRLLWGRVFPLGPYNWPL